MIPVLLSSGFFKRELKYLDVVTFLPTKSLKAKHIMTLCQDIFERGVKVKPDLRRGVWPHLVGVFHPSLEGREERERYMAKLRMVYDHLKGKLLNVGMVGFWVCVQCWAGR